jgi:hypothetical protein
MYTEFTIWDNWDGQLVNWRSSSGMKGCKFWASKAASAVVIMKRIRASFTWETWSFLLWEGHLVKDGERGSLCEDTEKNSKRWCYMLQSLEKREIPLNPWWSWRGYSMTDTRTGQKLGDVWPVRAGTYKVAIIYDQINDEKLLQVTMH